MRKISGSLTIFAALVIMLVSQFVFTLLEVGRYRELDKIAVINSKAEVESLMAEYNQPLWENYKILGYDVGYFGEKKKFNKMEKWLKDLSTINFAREDSVVGVKASNLLRLNMKESTAKEYILITDQNGEVYKKLVASYMKNNITYECAKKIYSMFKSYKELKDSGDFNFSDIEDAIEALEDGEDNKKGNNSRSDGDIATGDTSSKNRRGADSDENPLDSSVDAKKKGILSLVLPKDFKLSSKKININNAVSHRQLEEGVSDEPVDNTWYEDVLLSEYILNHLSSAVNVMKNRGLDYEQEYIISGKESDEENLKATCNKLLEIREIANIIYIFTDSTKQEEALTLATTLAGATANPLIIEAVKIGLLASWAYCESVLDVRALIQGDRIPLIKDKETWSSSITNISSLLSGNAKAKSSKTGLKYENYVGLLILLKNDKTVSYRAMDVQEHTVNCMDGYKSVRMDNLICDINVEMKYEYNGIFTNFVDLLLPYESPFLINKKVRYSYYE